MAATRDSIQCALDIIQKVNSMSQVLRGAADSIISIASQIDALTAITPKLNTLIEGLTALGVNVAVLNTDKTSMVSMANSIKSSIPELTKP